MSLYATGILRSSDEQLLKTEAAIHKSALEFTRGDGVSWREFQNGGKLAANKLQWREGGDFFLLSGKEAKNVWSFLVLDQEKK